MLLISEVMIANPGLDTFEDLVLVLKTIAEGSDERFFQMDVKPDYGDTPENWEDRLEAAFY
ncbi:sulfur relay protein DsrC [Candidatus Thiodubiliella endoseptemdiera]|uniref:Sulfur relay protein DsrC n=1 Tax=Candidatus Thiodubiliella endoseptemdiera TaxID=2738886 RepID=A0A853F7X1_9GAMM|nr:sulfur relay protein DsrC [Candidatus Thiodubiliella endoseptemdiera]